MSKEPEMQALKHLVVALYEMHGARELFSAVEDGEAPDLRRWRDRMVGECSAIIMLLSELNRYVDEDQSWQRG